MMLSVGQLAQSGHAKGACRCNAQVSPSRSPPDILSCSGLSPSKECAASAWEVNRKSETCAPFNENMMTFVCAARNAEVGLPIALSILTSPGHICGERVTATGPDIHCGLVLLPFSGLTQMKTSPSSRVPLSSMPPTRVQQSGR